MALSKQEIHRYSRQLLLEDFGIDGERDLILFSRNTYITSWRHGLALPYLKARRDFKNPLFYWSVREDLVVQPQRIWPPLVLVSRSSRSPVSSVVRTCSYSMFGILTGIVGVVDYDEVEINNLHRQVFHAEHRLGHNKAASLVESLSGCVKRSERLFRKIENEYSISTFG
jgi:hypothetical protein